MSAADRRALYQARLRVALAQLDGAAQPQPKRRGRDPLAPTGAQWFFGRICALECAHLWDCPPLVLEYLEGGDPRLSNLRADEAATGRPRDTAAGLASQHCAYRCYPGETLTQVAAAWSAFYAATGNYAGAAQWAIRALALDALEAAERQSDHPLSMAECETVSGAARLGLEGIFAERARDILGGDYRL